MFDILASIGISNMDFFEVLNPLYAFPIVGVIVCMFIVYTFGFKSPIQPPSFEKIEEDVKITKKKKTKDTSKKDQGKVSQNGKVTGSKSKSPGKRKEEKVADKVSVEKPVAEKKAAKKKASNESKTVQEKKKSFSNEDISEDGWVQLVSKKSRKNKKDDAGSSENMITTKNPVKQSVDVKTEKTMDCPPRPGLANPSRSTGQSDDSFFWRAEHEKIEDMRKHHESLVNVTTEGEKLSSEESPENKKGISNKNSDSKEHQQAPQELQDISVIENKENALNHTEVDTEMIIENAYKENSSKNIKAEEKSSNKSKKKKKTHEEKVDMNIELENVSEQVNGIAEFTSHSVSIESPVKIDTTVVTNDKIEENVTKESKSNVAFDEMEGLYPQAKEQKKKKKVRRDH